MEDTYHPDFEATSIFKDYGSGTLGVYPKPYEMEELMNLILEDFPEIVQIENVG